MLKAIKRACKEKLLVARQSHKRRIALCLGPLAFPEGREGVKSGAQRSACSVLCPGGMTCEQTKDKNRSG